VKSKRTSRAENESAQGALLVEVALPVPLPDTFTYRYVLPSDPPPQDRPAPDPPSSRSSAESASPSAARSAQRAPRRGDLVAVPFGRRREVIGLVVGAQPVSPATTEVNGFPLRDVRRLLPAVYRLNGERRRLARWMADYYALPLGEVVPLFHPPAPGTRRGKSRHRATVFPTNDPTPIELTAAQREAVSTAGEHLQGERFGSVLVHGVTGSGKTEVFLQVIEQALERGRSAIYLLPEIALTPQTLARITARFGDRAATMHSGLSAGQRCHVHEAAARGEVRVVVGPRSALFAPVVDLGVIVVDEEHESSYKQDEKPRYHARHTALVRGRENRAVVLLGSATPDLESFDNGQRGRFSLVTLPDRMGGPLPTVETVDLRGGGAQDGFSQRLIEHIGETLAADRQVILFYNRRGFARVLQCQACGEALMCPSCDIGLTYHLRPRRLLCHYCGFTRPVPESCPACNEATSETTTSDTSASGRATSDDAVFLPAGGGTEKVELSLAAYFPDVSMLRLDHDTTRRRGSHERILGEFAAGQAQILVGTQMVAKGHHFPAVGLVGVLAADDGLTLPDFRASERSFQLLTQVAGRAGRTSPGTVVFQTYQPEHPVILAAARHDFHSFVTTELECRRELGYPPYRRLIRVGLSGRRLGATEAAAAALATAVRDVLQQPDRDILGPAPGVFPRLHDRYRFQLLIKGSISRREKQWLAECARALRSAERGLDVVIDVDPLSVY